MSGSASGQQPASTTASQGGGSNAKQPASAKLWDAVVTKVVPVVLSTAFVGAVGAAITWLHFWTAGLPADQAAGHLALEDRVIPGAETLIVFVVLGVLAVAVVYAIDPPGNPTNAMRHGLLALVNAEVIVALAFARQPATITEIAVGVSLALGVLGQLLIYYPAEIVELRTVDGRGRIEDKPSKIADWRTRALAALHLPGLVQRAENATVKGSGDDAWYERPVTWFAYVVAFFAIAGQGAAAYFLFAPETAWDLGIAGLLGMLVFRVCRTTREFWTYGLAVFASVALFGGLFVSIRLFYTPQVETFALVRKADPPGTGMVGLYVGQDDDNYWLARVHIGCNDDGEAEKRPIQASGYITPIAKSDVAAHAIGAPVTLPDANGRAQAMLADLLYTRGDASSDAPAAPPAVAFDCTPCPRPRLKGVSWRHGGDGGALQAAGTGLGRSGKLTLDGKRLHVDSWSPTAIAFRLGQSSASGKLVADCGRASNALDLAVPSPPPATGQLEAGGSAVAIRARSRVFRLDAGLSHDTDGTVVSWRWHAEHGRLIGANNRSAVYVMASPPKATVVKLTITDDHQRTATAQVPVRPGAAIVQISTAVLFKTGSSQLTAEGRVHLRGLRTDVDGARSLRVVGHTDAVGSEAHNRGLAKRRAAAVYAYLTRGIERPPSRRPPLARGETRPIATNETPAGRALNRRVTILIRLMPPSA